jgi:hypothetical protein
MSRHLLQIGLAVVCLTTPAAASISVSFGGLPATYTPGGAFTFDVRLEGATNLNLYNIDLVLNSNLGTAGTDFYFLGQPSTDRPANSGNTYVFDEDQPGGPYLPVGFLATPSVFGNQAILNLSDFLTAGEISTVAAPYVIVAQVTVGSTAGAGDLTIGFDNSTMELKMENLDPIPDFDNLEISAPVSVLSETAAIPEPSACVVWSLLGFLGTAAEWLRRKQRSSVSATDPP